MEELKNKIQEFVEERDWDKFHSPKNLAMALNVEAAELLELFQWLSENESHYPTEEQLLSVKEEVGDVMIYLISFCNKYGLDPIQCALTKLELNKEKYPADRVKGNSKKYTQY